jgi:hypothetical protein
MAFIAIGIGAGLTAALLFGVVITGSPLAMLLSYLAPLPILIAALGWHHRSGIVAILTGGLATAVALRPEAGLAFALGAALPAWWIAYLALLGRPDGSGRMEWYPLGRLLLWIAIAASLVTFAGVFALGDGSYEGYRSGLRQGIESVLQAPSAPPASGTPPGGIGSVVETLVDAVPFIASAVFTLVFTLNLWLAAKTVRTSQRLPRDWPFLPATTLPHTALALLAGAIVGSFLPGFIGVAGLSLAGALVIVFSLQGLSFLHQATVGRPGRVGLLSVVYVLAVFVGHTVLPMLAVLGMADAAFSLRNRFGSGGPGPNLPST